MLRQIGALLALEPGNRFRAQAYERAAGVVESLADLEAVAAQGRWTSLPGVGPAIAGVLESWARTGRSATLERLRKQYPPGTAELAQVLSLPRIRAVHAALGVTSLAELRSACEDRRLRGVPGFGAKSERKLLERIVALETRGPARSDVILPQAAAQAEALRSHMLRHPAVDAVEIAGELRRRMETIGRLDLVVASRDPAAVFAHAGRAPGIGTVEQAGAGGFVMRRLGGLDAHVRTVPPADLALALIGATGSPGHTAKLAQVARRKRLVLEGDALRRRGRKLRVASEAEVYGHLGLDYVPAELREDEGEIEAAAQGELPADLVRVEDIRGAIHCHTVHSDGRHTIEEMARAAEALGLSYITITDHSRSASYANGLDHERLLRQADEIAEVQERVDIRLLHGTECDILEDGALDYPKSVLKRLAVVIASIHRRHKLDADAMTERLVRALRHPLFKIWGHALGRYVLSRPPIECHMDRVLDAVARSRAAIEVNGDPNRLDLAPQWIREARKRGIPFVVSTDAHSTEGLRNLRWGVDMARRGWLRRSEVLNTLAADAFAEAVRP
jgi:DNA polymerase (family 10)